jgi:tRNA1(Val) A37 N6-methylase TrmN6
VKRHDTPHDVAVALSRHAPRRIRALLDPAVGAGNLIAPLAKRLKEGSSTVYCVDSDRVAIDHVSEEFRYALPETTHYIHSDFLSWSIRRRRPRFDCIVVNPPFAATKGMLHPLEIPSKHARGTTTVRYMPLEAAFMCRAIDLLEPNGRLLAVVPCSVVMSDGLQWFRDEMLMDGAIRFVHELPPRCFPGVESRMYLMVFDKGVGQRRITLLNHDLHEPERLVLDLSDNQVTRFDFGYVSAAFKLGSLLRAKSLNWKKLGDVAEVIRGDIGSPIGPQCAVHSTDYRSGFWRFAARHDASVVVKRERKVRRGDILMSRVGRNASRSAGRGIGICGMSCSDCVIIIRPKAAGLTLKLLFALRVILSFAWAKPLVERGTGASYISHNCLLELPLPIDAWKRYPRQYQLFAEGERARSAEQSHRAVEAVAKQMARHSSSSA